MGGRGFSALAGRGKELEITHLFYVDDALIFYEAKEAKIRHIRAIPTN